MSNFVLSPEYLPSSLMKVNYTESTITFVKGTSSDLQFRIMNMISISKIGGFSKYLGWPENRT